MKIYGYTRLNKLRTRPKNLSIQKQTAIIREYARSRDLKIQKIFSDVEDTSTSLELPNLKKIISLVEAGEMTTLIVARLDRVTRSIRSIHEFIQTVCDKHEVTLISVEEGLDSSTDHGKLALQMIDIIGKWDAKMISDRTKEFIARKRSIGENVGHAPFGFVYRNKKLMPFAEELKIVYLIRQKRDHEELSYHKIAKFLNESNIPSKRGKRWHAETIKTIYENPLYNEQSCLELVNIG